MCDSLIVSPSNPAPLILTLAFDPASFDRLDGMRRRYFPPDRNFVPAHITLFHHLPGSELVLIESAVKRACRDTAPIPLQITGLRSLGRGVAYAVSAPELLELRAALARDFSPWLTPQDRQNYRSHITIQNKVDAAAARATLLELQSTFSPFPTTGAGLHLWRYLGGPWQLLHETRFERRRLIG